VTVSGEELSIDRAMFLSFSTGTLTGFQLSIGAADFNPESREGPAILLILVVAGSLFTMIVGAMAAVRALRLNYSDSDVVNAALTAQLSAMVIGAAGLALTGVNVSDGFYEAACAFGNCGAVVTGRAHRLPGFATIGVQGVLLPLSILGGLGLPVLMDLFHRIFSPRRALSRHTQTTLTLAAGVYLLGTWGLFIALSARPQAKSTDLATASQWDQGDQAMRIDDARHRFIAASTMAINSRSMGLPLGLESRFIGPSQWLIVLLMMVGASSAGTGGGIKAGTLYEAGKGVRSALVGGAVKRSAGVAAVWIAGYLVIAGVCFFLLACLQQEESVERLMFIVVSAVSNVGLSHDAVSLVGPSLGVLIGGMLLGRLVPLAILWWLAGRPADVDLLVG
jgi:Trk-type K+ transport system membrane component